MYFRNYRLRKRWLDKSLKSNMVKGPKHCSNVNHSTFGYLLMNVKAIELEKVSLSDRQILRTIF